MSTPIVIALTGGPCAGKTTTLSHLVERLSSLGFKVFVVPEAASMLIGGGINPVELSQARAFAFQVSLTRLQMTLEDTYVAQATLWDGPSVVLCDRGCMDGKAYVPADFWKSILDAHTVTEGHLRDDRYDAVIHMVTAADGALEGYTLANNAARSESPELAREIDRKLQQAWVGHAHLRIVRNEGDFRLKIRQTMAAVCRVIGVPEPLEIERKYLVESVGDFPVHGVDVDISQVYLHGGGRIRSRGQGTHRTYTHTLKYDTGVAGKRTEIERRINRREYDALLSEADPDKQPIVKVRRCFLWEGRYFELDTFTSPRPGLQLLEVELDDLDEKVELPPFIRIVRDVTEEPGFANKVLARIV